MTFLQRIFGDRPEVDLSGLKILDHARVYLEQYGEGRDNEFIRARNILIQARVRILNQ